MVQHQLYVKHVLNLAANQLLHHQSPSGAFEFCCEVDPLPDALVIIFLYLLDMHDDPLIHELANQLVQSQHPDGSWVAYPDQTVNISTTTLVYFSLILAGYNKQHPILEQASKYIQSHGGIRHASTLTKVVLAVAGQLPWSSLPDPHIELIHLQRPFPVTLYDFTAPARAHIPSIMVLAHLHFSLRIPETLSITELGTAVRRSENGEHQPVVDAEVDKDSDRLIRTVNHRAVEQCKKFILNRIEPDGTIAGYLTATILGVFALMAIGYDRCHPVVQKACDGIRGLVFRNGVFVHQQLFTSTVWDTALCMRAIHALRHVECLDPTVRLALDHANQRGIQYLVSRQHVRTSDWQMNLPDIKPGGWAFSHTNTLYPDVDDTSAVLRVLFPFRNMYRHAWKRGMHWLLGMQNRDGGWSAFDHNCNKTFLELIPVNDMGIAMTDPSTPDMTGHVLELLGHVQHKPQSAITAGVHWLQKNQRSDGSWDGRWGVKYIYGTSAALCGLCACGMNMLDPCIQQAVAWLSSVQNPDGGYGESCRSERARQSIQLGASTVSQTAWALLGLLAATPKPQHKSGHGSRYKAGHIENIERAVAYLLRTAQPVGGWCESYPTGTAILEQAYIHYHSYAYVWPILSLCKYLRVYT